MFEPQVSVLERIRAFAMIHTPLHGKAAATTAVHHDRPPNRVRDGTARDEGRVGDDDQAARNHDQGRGGQKRILRIRVRVRIRQGRLAGIGSMTPRASPGACDETGGTHSRRAARIAIEAGLIRLVAQPRTGALRQ
jgi:hypothetical protein